MPLCPHCYNTILFMNNITMVRVVKERLNYKVRERTQRAKTYDISINI